MNSHVRNWIVCSVFVLAFFSPDVDARSSKVWVNSKSHVYHCEDARWYGRTKRGFFVEEVDAISRGYRAANNNRCSNAGRAAVSDLPNQEGADNKVWVNTNSHVYHCQGSRYYGNTKRGRFMNQSEALTMGGRPAGGKRCN